MADHRAQHLTDTPRDESLGSPHAGRPRFVAVSRGPLRRAARVLLAVALLPSLLHCAAGAAGTSERYPEKKRPDAPRSASDGEVLGAQRQDPADTLEGSLTNQHGAARSPHAEEPEAEAAHERLEHEQCIDAARAAAMPGTEARKRPVCPPAPKE